MKLAIEVNKVVKHFGGVKAVDDVSFSVPQSSIFGLLGPNGAGKTTLVKMMATLLKPDAGRIRIEGDDVVLSPETVRPRIGLTGQYASVDEFLTGRENVEMVGRLYHLPYKLIRQRAGELLTAFSLAEVADRQVKTYSGGMRRRLDFIASLIAEPAVLFLDEPTTGLDPRSRYEAWEIIRGLVGKGTTVLLTTQYLEEADFLAQKIAVLNLGKVVASGTANELKNRLGGDIVEFAFRSKSDAAQALTLVTPLAHKPPVFDSEAKTIRIPVSEGSKSLLKLTRLLQEAGVEPDEVALHRPSLDDVFLALTGHRTSESPADHTPSGERS